MRHSITVTNPPFTTLIKYIMRHRMTVNPALIKYIMRHNITLTNPPFTALRNRAPLPSGPSGS